jgi:hypothetical protein
VLCEVSTEEEEGMVMAAGFVPWTDEGERKHHATYRDGRFDEINLALDYERRGMAPAIGLLANSATLEEYQAKLKDFFNERRLKAACTEVRNG